MIAAWLMAGRLLWSTVLMQEAGVDSTATFAQPPPDEHFAARTLEPYADLRSWIERVENRPGLPPDDLDRAVGVIRFGLRYIPVPLLEVAVGLRVGGLTEDNETFTGGLDGGGERVLIWPDNEDFDELDLDEVAAASRTMDGSSIAAGRIRSPLALTEMIWDADLRPVGVAAGLSMDRFGLHGGRISGGWLQRDEWTEDAWMATGQASIARDLPGSGRWDVLASYLEFGRLDRLPFQGFARQNTMVIQSDGRRYAEEFRIVDLQAGGTTRLGSVPVSARVDVARNLAADEDNDAIRTRLALGGNEAPIGLELGWIYQRIERDAVCGAFNSDDWWFHSRMRGHLGWLAVGVGRAFGLRLTATAEQRDDLTTTVYRYRAEFLARALSR